MDSTVRRVLSSAILCGLTLSTGPLLAGARVVSGQWEHTMTTEGEASSKTVKVCMSAEEAGGINGDTASARAYFEKKMRGPCKIKAFTLKGDTMSYALSCGERSIENTVTFHGETSEGVTITKAPDGTDTMHVKSRRLGACP